MTVDFKKAPYPQQTDMAKEMAQEHPSIRIPVGSTDQKILDVMEQVYRGQYEVAPTVLPCRCQD